MEEVKLSEQEKKVLAEADELLKLKAMKGWHLALTALDAWAKLAEARRDANLSGSPRVAMNLQVVARERRAAANYLPNYIEEVAKARKEMLADIFKVDIETMDAAEQEELELRAGGMEL